MLQRASLALALSVAAIGCDKLPFPGRKVDAGPPPAGVTAVPEKVQEGKALMEKGQLDEALAKLAELPDDPVSLYYQGIIYVRKGMGTPLPETGYRPEDKNAAVLLERAIAAKPEFAAAHFALAGVLLPYTEQRHGPAAKKKPARAATQALPDDPDVSPERVARAYQAAVQHDKSSNAPVEALIKYARDMKRPDDADVAYRELLARNKESAAALISYGDFLAHEKKDPMRAIEQYQLALMWTPQDAVPNVPKEKIGMVYLDWAEDHFTKGEWANAAARLKDSQKWVTDPASPAGQRLRGLQAKLAEIRR
jgi:tetratricopeptide (TPR) repeat protein